MSANVREEKNWALALVLASGASVASAAEQFQICTNTIYRYLDTREFRRLVADCRARLFTEALGRMTGNLTRAADALARLVETGEPSVQLRAARALLTLSTRLEESVSTTDRVRELE